MKLELKIGDKSASEGFKEIATHDNHDKEQEKEQVTIDICQVMAASQALLKNLAAKIDALETKLLNLENVLRMEKKRIKLENAQRKFLLEPPKVVVKAWQPNYPELNDDYFKSFSLFDRLFHPEKMRRKGVEN